MSLVGEITTSYRQPLAALSQQVARGVTDAQTLFYAMLFGFLNFLAGLPALSLQAGPERPLFALTAANLVVTLFVVPLVLFAFAAVCAAVVSWRGGTIEWVLCRRIVAWAALVAAPLVLLGGVLEPVLPGTVTLLVQLIIAFVFLRQLIVGLNGFGFQSAEQV